MPNPAKGRTHFVPRHAEASVRTALADTRVVAVVGPRQSGKTTLVRQIAQDGGRPFVTLDDEISRRFAIDDPTGFLRAFPSAAIDEIQRSPDLILALKRTVDDDPRSGRYIVTGSVDLFRRAISPDTLAGRVESVTLLPFSQAEIEVSAVPTFLHRAFSGDFPRFAVLGPTSALVERVLIGGYPEAVARPIAARRAAWLRSYARVMARRDVEDAFRVSKRDQMARLVRRAAFSSGGLLNFSRIGSELGVNAKTVDRWLILLQHLFLLRRVEAWHRNDLKRLVKTPRLHFLDSGLLAVLRRVGAPAIKRDRTKIGPLLECFVYSELIKLVDLAEEDILVSHYRDKDGVEVDFVLERADGKTVGIEVKGTATARPAHSRGLMRLKAACADKFACGILLHDGDRVQQIAPRVFVMPFKMLWES